MSLIPLAGRRPALVLLIVLAGAGWGKATLAQEGSANARTALAGGVEPDTTAPWRYYPLAVGNVWEYEGEEAPLRVNPLEQVAVVKDTVASGRRYFVLQNTYTERGDTVNVSRYLVRFDTASATVRALNEFAPPTEWVYTCPLDAPFGGKVSDEDCDGRSAGVVGGYDGILLFEGEHPGIRTDTVRTAMKEYRSLYADRYAADIGLVSLVGDGYSQELIYYRVNGEERGVTRFPTPSGPTPPANGAALTVGPNPTGGAATVRLDLPAPADVRVAVYDVLGRRVATLASGALGAGAHALPFDAAPLAPGVYVVRAEVGGAGGVGVLVRRVTVAR